MTLDEVKHAAETALFQTEAGKILAVAELWRSIEWKEGQGDPKAGAQSSSDNPLEITVYDLSSPSPLLREFGRVIFSQVDPLGQQIWVDKLGLVDDNQAGRVQRILSEAEATDYASLLAKVSSLLDRYVLLNCINALQANKVSFANARRVNLQTYGPTEEYMLGRRYHSMVCILSPYFRRDLFEDFGEAFTELVENGEDLLGTLHEANVILRSLVIKVLRRLGHGQPPSKF